MLKRCDVLSQAIQAYVQAIHRYHLTMLTLNTTRSTSASMDSSVLCLCISNVTFHSRTGDMYVGEASKEDMRV